jgi:hypothetical protein
LSCHRVRQKANSENNNKAKHTKEPNKEKQHKTETKKQHGW